MFSERSLALLERHYSWDLLREHLEPYGKTFLCVDVKRGEQAKWLRSELLKDNFVYGDTEEHKGFDRLIFVHQYVN